MFKYAVDILTTDPTGATAAATPLVTLMPATLLLGYGAARAGSALFNELRNAVFAKVMYASCYQVQVLPRCARQNASPLRMSSSTCLQVHASRSCPLLSGKL